MSNHKFAKMWAEYALSRKIALDHHGLDDYSTMFSRKYLKKPLIDICKPFKGAYQMRENKYSFVAGLKRLVNCIIYLGCQVILVFALLPLVVVLFPIIILTCIVFTLAEIFTTGFKPTSVMLKNFIIGDLPEMLGEVALQFVAICDSISLTIVNLTYAAAQIISPLKIIPRSIITLVMYGFDFQPIEEVPSIKKLVSKDCSFEKTALRDLAINKIEKALIKGQLTRYTQALTVPSEQGAAYIFDHMPIAARPRKLYKQ